MTVATNVEKTITTADSGDTSVLSVRDLEVQFLTDHGWVSVVSGLSYEVGRGEILGVVGESGSGKSVSSLAAMGLMGGPGSRVTKGSVRLEGRELLGLPERSLQDLRGSRISMIFQEPMTSLNPAFTVGDQIAEVVRRHEGLSKREARARAIEGLQRVGIPNAERRVRAYPYEFSGGMRQRAMIAMAIACDPAVLIADEPTTALDVTIQSQILDLLREMRAELGVGMVFITHNMGVVAEICDRVVVMYAGQLVEQAKVHDLFRHPRHPYTEGLMFAMPQLQERQGRLPSIPGATPPPWSLPAGCRFEPRCPYSTESCTEQVPVSRLADERLARCVRVEDLELRGRTHERVE